MYFLTNFCCICFNDKKKLKRLYKYKDLYSKLKLFMLSELLSESSKEQALICKKCINYIKEIFIFREKCLKNISLFEHYINQLQLYNESASELSISLSDTRNDITVCNIKSELQEDFNVNDSIEFEHNSEFNNIKLEYELLNDFKESQNDDECETSINDTFNDFGTMLEISIKQEDSTYNEPSQDDINDDVPNFDFIASDIDEKPDINEINSEVIISDFEDELEKFTINITKHEIRENISDENIPDINDYQILNNEVNYSDAISITSDNENNVEFTINTHKSNFVKDYFEKSTVNENNAYNMENNKNKYDTYKKLYNKCLKKHMKEHKIKYRCKVCKMFFISKYKLNKHILSHKKKNNTNLDVKSQEETLTNSEENNIYNSHDISTNNDFKNNLDLKNKSILEELKNLKKDKNTNDLLKCSCNKIFTTLNQLRLHKKTHDKFQCHICNSFFSSKFKLITHSYTHIGINIYRCLICKKIFINKSKFEEHMEQHRFKCDKCNKIFNYACTLETHCCPAKIS